MVSSDSIVADLPASRWGQRRHLDDGPAWKRALRDEPLGLAEDLKRARQVQELLLPRASPHLTTLSCSGECLPAGSVGGDYFDFLPREDGRLGIVLADVSGKGFPAAILMASLQAQLRSLYALTGSDLLRLLGRVNAQFFRSIAANRFATLFFGDYDDATRRLRYVNCSHLPPAVLRSHGAVQRLQPTATPIGAFPAWEGAVGEVRLGPGDILLAVSDGVTEASRDDGEEFGDARMIRHVGSIRHLAPSRICRSLLGVVDGFGGRRRGDDRTVVVARGRRASGGPPGTPL